MYYICKHKNKHTIYITMTTQATIKPEWLEMIDCCSPKVQMDLIRAIVAWQTEGVIPEFRGAKKAIFLIMVRDLDPEAAVLIAAAIAKPSKTKKTKSEPEADTAPNDAESAAESAESTAPQPQRTEPQPGPTPSPAPASAPIRKRKNSPRYFCGRPLY